jgi:putative DNA primase/helicase
VRRVPYRLPELVEAVGAKRLVFILEGEKDADRVRELGFAATCNSGGAGKFTLSLAAHFRGARAVIIPDNDGPGREHAQDVAIKLQGIASEVRVVDLPDLPPKGDVSQWLDAGGTAEQLLELVDRHCSEPFRPIPEAGNLEIVEHSGTGPARVSVGENLTDMGNARRLVTRHGKDLRFVPVWGMWLVWDGRRWSRDETGEVERRAKDTVRSIYAEAFATSDSDKRQAIAKHAAKSESERAVRAMIALAKTEPGIPVTPAELDADPWLFNVQNGTLQLRSGALQPHRREDLITKVSPVAFDAAARCPTLLAFLDRTMAGRVDLVGFIQRLVGYTLTGVTTEQILALLYGMGANGKSTLLELVAELMGDYGQSIEFSTLLARGQDSTRNDLARLVGARFVAGSEAEDGRRFSEVLVKQLTGGDKITARFLFKEYFDFRPQFKLWLAANHKPVIRGTDLAIWRRIRLVPCTVTIPEAERDPNLPGKLRAELPGVLAWAVRGCLAWQQDGLGMPQAVRDATNEYREEMDVLGGFLSERCEARADALVKASELYAAYKAWCEASGERALNQTRFGTALGERGLEKEKTRTGIFYSGLALVNSVNSVTPFRDNFSIEKPHIESTPKTSNNPSHPSHHAAPDIAPIEELDRAAGDYIRL